MNYQVKIYGDIGSEKRSNEITFALKANLVNFHL